MYSCNDYSFDFFSGCVYSCTNNCYLGNCVTNYREGVITPHDVSACRYNGKQNVSLHSNRLENQKVTVVTWCSVMFTNIYWQNTVLGSTRYLAFYVRW